MCAYVLSYTQPFKIPWTVAHQTPLAMGFLKQEYWNGLPFPLPVDLLDPGSACLLHWQVDSSLLSHLGSSSVYCIEFSRYRKLH